MRRYQPGTLTRMLRADQLGLYALGAVSLAVFAVLTGTHEGSSRAWGWFDNTGEALAAVAAAIACAVRLRRERVVYASVSELSRQELASDAAVSVQRQTRLAWSLLTMSMAAWALGQIGWTVLESGLGIEPAPPTPLDALFLSSSLLIVAGLLVMVRTPAGYLSYIRASIEGLFIAAGVLLCSWNLLIGPVWQHHDALTLGGAVNLAYPVLDSMALAAVLFVIVRRRQDPPAGLGLLAVGIVCVAVADFSFWYFGTTGPTLPAVSVYDSGWVAGFLLIAAAALRSGRPGSRAQWLAQSRAALALPALPATAGVLVIAGGWALGDPLKDQGALLGTTVAVLLIAVALLLIVFFENESLTTHLERRVKERTAELHATERYYRALVEHSSDAVIVIDPDLSIRYVSDSIGRVFGYGRAQLEGRPLEVLGRAALQPLGEALRRVRAAPDRSTRVEWPLTDAAGRVRHAESTISDQLDNPHIRGFVLNTRDDTDRAALAEQLRDQAFHDPLTGLPNRALLSDRASQAFARAGRTGGSVALMVVDLDSFKLTNDRYGHAVGDEVLRVVAERLRSAVRPGDTVARLGGDEFAILMETLSDAEGALRSAERVRRALRRSMPLDGNEHRITASIGVAVGAAPGTNFEQLLCDADVAVYSVKGAGKDSVLQFQPSMQQRARDRFELQADLRRAIENEEFSLLYQPEFDAETEQLRGFEALIRWNHPTHGLLAPDRFIPLAEETGLIVPIGRWTLLEALRQATRWQRADGGGPPLTIAVNVSAVQLGAPALVADVQDALRRSGIHPGRVVLEITESSLVERSPRTIETLGELKRTGVCLAIDDFGTGYASVAYLQTLPFDILKVDRSFIASSQDRRRRELFEAVVNIGHALSLTTIAEGIEQPSQLEMARRAGCDIAQGYLLGRPAAPEVARQLIDDLASAPEATGARG